MRRGIPFVYTVYRSLWTVVHLSLVGVAAAVFVSWFLEDERGVLFLTNAWSDLSAVQMTVANVIPFPWGM